MDDDRAKTYKDENEKFFLNSKILAKHLILSIHDSDLRTSDGPHHDHKNETWEINRELCIRRV
jgi:hypothetical protein